LIEASWLGGITSKRRDRICQFSQPRGEWKTIAHDPRILWPDTLSVAADGYLYFTANQLHRQPQFHEGQDLRQKPYTLFRIKIDAGPVILK
jgi:sugar lactone lactonase YvrE